MRIPTRSLAALVFPFVLVAAPAVAANVACNDVIDGTTVVLDGDVGPCPSGQEITVQNGGTLDLNGNTVTCDGGMFGIGVLISNGGTVRNGTVSGCEFSGVQVGGAQGGLVEYVVSTNNTGSGFLVYSTGPSTLRYNTASDNDDDGFFVSASGSKLTSNIAFNNGSDGFVISGSGAKIAGNRAVENFSYGYQISGGANKLKGNSASSNGGMGFYVTGNGNSLGSCTSDGHSFSYYISGNDNVLSKSSASVTSSAGLYLNGDNNTISGCRFADGNQGILQSAFAENNAIKKNQSWGHSTFDFASETVTCGTNVWTGNKGGSRSDACME